MVQLYCPDCGTTIDAEPGREARCPSCGFTAEVPAHIAPDVPPDAPAYTTPPFDAPASGHAPIPMLAPQPMGVPRPPGGYMEPRTNGMCTASLIMGLAGLCPFLSFVLPVLAIVFGVIGKNQANERHEKGEGMAIAGVVLGSVELALSFMWLLMVLPSWTGGFVAPGGMWP